MGLGTEIANLGADDLLFFRDRVDELVEEWRQRVANGELFSVESLAEKYLNDDTLSPALLAPGLAIMFAVAVQKLVGSCCRTMLDSL